MNKLLMVVDSQIDFIGGSLSVNGAAEVMDALANYIHEYGGQYDYIPGGHSLSIGKPDATNSGQVTYLHTFDFIAGSTTVPHVDEDTLIFALNNYNLNPSTPHFVDITFTHRVILDADFEFTIEELQYQEFTDEELNNLTISIGQAGAAPEGENN